MIGSLPPHKGVSPSTIDLCTALAARSDIELDVVAFGSLYPRALYPGGDPEDGSGARPNVAGAQTRRPLRWWNPLGWLLAGLTLRGDVVHAQWWSYPLAPVYAVLLGCARLRGKRVVITMHNVEPHERGLFRRLANLAVLPFAHRIIVHSADNARTLRRTAGSTPVDVVPLGVRSAAEPLPDRNAARRRFGLRDDAPVVLFFGNIRPYKGVSELLAAFSRVRDALPAARLMIVGQPWNGGADRLRAEIKRLGLSDAVLDRMSYVPDGDIAGYFAAADVVAYPYTHFAAQSAAACMALTYGKAIVVTNIGGLPELAGDASAVVAPNDTAQLASALVRVLTDDAYRTKLESHARELSEQMSWPVVARTTADVYARLMQIDEQALAARSSATADSR